MNCLYNNEKEKNNMNDLAEKSSLKKLDSINNTLFELKNPLINSTKALTDIVNKQSNILREITHPYNNLQNYISDSLMSPLNKISNTLNSIAQSQLKMINENVIEAMTSPLMKAINQIAESQRAMMNNVLSSLSFNNPFFESLSKSLEEARANPNSIYSWFDYYDKLSEFFWIYPYKMKPKELHEVLNNVTTEKEFDKYISKYFDKKKVALLIKDIKSMVTKKQDLKLFEQIMLAYDNKSYSLASMGLISIIDNLLSYYLLNKGCTSRVKMFEPIIEDIDRTSDISDDFPFIVMMINSNINLLYEDIEFNEKIKIKTNKKSRRNPVSHGKSYSNKKIDTIMLFNTVYYLLLAREELKVYKNSLCYDKNKKKFYFPDKNKKKEIKKKIRENIAKRKN